MSKPGRHQHIVHDYRQQLARGEKQAVQQLETAYAQVLKTLEPSLDHLYDQMVKAMANGQKIPAHFLYEANRLESIKKLIETSIDHYSVYSRAEVERLQRWAAHLGQESAQQLMQETVPRGVSWTWGRPSTDAIENIVGATGKGSPLSDLFDGFGREAAEKAGRALITGLALGQNPRMVAGFVQDALEVSRARALTVARTEMIRSYRAMQIENFRANSDVIDGWTWICALLKSSCAACIAMHGTHHSLDETLDEHPSGACTMVPDTKSWADILSPLGIDTSGIEDVDNEVQSGADWFNNQDAATQQSILGPGKYQAWKDGKFDFADIVGYDESDDWGTSIKERPLKDLVKA